MGDSMSRAWVGVLFVVGAVGCNTVVPEELSCGPGTLEIEDECVPDDSSSGAGGSSSSGPQATAVGAGGGSGGATGTTGSTMTTTGSGLTCGPGTFESDGQCIPDGGPGAPGFYVVVAGTEIPADGFTKIPVRLFAIDDNGDAIPAPVVVAPSRVDAGLMSPSSLTLGQLGGDTYFVPCNSATSPTCLGDFSLELFLATDLTQVVATSAPLHLVDPPGVGSGAPCQVSGNRVFFDGDSGDYIHPGIDTIVDGAWSANGGTDLVSVHVDPSDDAQGLWWDLYFSTDQLGQPLTTQVYEGAQRWPFEQPNHPGLSISGDGRGCNMLTGRFEIHELVTSGNSLISLLATFEQHCEGGGPALRGCVHYGP